MQYEEQQFVAIPGTDYMYLTMTLKPVTEKFLWIYYRELKETNNYFDDIAVPKTTDFYMATMMPEYFPWIQYNLIAVAITLKRIRDVISMENDRKPQNVTRSINIRTYLSNYIQKNDLYIQMLLKTNEQTITNFKKYYYEESKFPVIPIPQRVILLC